MTCVKCGKKAKDGFSIDLDIKPILFCEDCKDDVKLAMIMIMQGTPEMCLDFTKNWERPFKFNKRIIRD